VIKSHYLVQKRISVKSYFIIVKTSMLIIRDSKFKNKNLILKALFIEKQYLFKKEFKSAYQQKTFKLTLISGGLSY
jgi:hypothetical protein